MKNNEKIKRIIEAIDLTIEALTKQNSKDYFAHKNTVKLLALKNETELDDLFKDKLPPSILGRFDSDFKSLLQETFLNNSDMPKKIKLLTDYREIICKYCNFINLTVFYSWQSDLPNSTNRTFIQEAIKNSIKQLNKNLNASIILDQDTRGESGSPDIVNTILKKIDSSDVFICDVSSVCKNTDNEMPNSNVLLELGYAIKCLGDSKIIMIFNESSGDIEKLPFDLGLKRQMVYHCEEGQVDKANERKNLEVSITKALELIISNL